MTADSWIHVAELVMVLLLLPGIKSLVGTLQALQKSALSISITLDSHQQAFKEHRDSFKEHLRDDRANFVSLESQIHIVDGNVRELQGAVDRRQGDRRTIE